MDVLSKDEQDKNVLKRLKKTLKTPDEDVMSIVLGRHDENIKTVEEAFPVKVVIRGNEITITGEDEYVVELVYSFLDQLVDVIKKGHYPTSSDVKYGVKTLLEYGRVDLKGLYEDVICLTARGKPVRPRTFGQKRYIKEIKSNYVTFAIGPAGTGKTYLAVAVAVSALKNREVSRIILVRPAVEAGEKLGYLPGDLREKVEPYLRPLYDAFYDLLSPERFLRYIEKGVIEIAPLAYMRGRTLNDSFIILDEAQNATPEQMKMFLTRIGFGSKVVVTGDVTQIDLPQGKESGLVVVQRVLKGIDNISFVYLTNEDVVRHEIVQQIVRAYEEYEKNKEMASKE